MNDAQHSPPGPPPTVSVVCPTYNAPGFLRDTLATVFAQTFADFEVVVVDDGSTDDTPAVLAELQREHGPRLRVVRQANAGIGAARNRGIDEARGRYVALLDHDDLWHPAKLAEQVAFMDAHPECVACSVPWSYTPTPDECVFDPAIAGPDGVVDRPLRRLADGHVFMISSAILFDRERAKGLRYETRRRCIEDTPFQLGLMMRGRFGIAGLKSGKMLMVYRVHTTNYSSMPDFSYNGRAMLRRQMRDGVYDGFDAAGRRDLDAFMAGIGRWATVDQLLAGKRLRAARVYLGEMLPNLRDGRLRFVAMLPPLLLAPKRLLALKWPQVGNRVGTRTA